MHSCSPSNYIVQLCSVSHIFLFFCEFTGCGFLPRLCRDAIPQAWNQHCPHRFQASSWEHMKTMNTRSLCGEFFSKVDPLNIQPATQKAPVWRGEQNGCNVTSFDAWGNWNAEKWWETWFTMYSYRHISTENTHNISQTIVLSSHAEAPTKAFLQVRYRCEIFNNVQGLPHDTTIHSRLHAHWCHRYIFKSVYPSKLDSYSGYTVSIVTSGLSFDCILLQIRVQVFWMKHQLASWECPPIQTLYSFFAKLGGIKCCSPVFAWYCSSVSLCPGFICTFYWPLVMQWHTTCKTDLCLPTHNAVQGLRWHAGARKELDLKHFRDRYLNIRMP